MIEPETVVQKDGKQTARTAAVDLSKWLKGFTFCE